MNEQAPQEPPRELWVTFDQDEPDCVWRSREDADAWAAEMQRITRERDPRQVRRYILAPNEAAGRKKSDIKEALVAWHKMRCSKAYLDPGAAVTHDEPGVE